MPKLRSLTLRREALAELTTTEIARVAGGVSGLACLSVPDCGNTADCFSLICTNGWCASDFQQCTTGIA